MLLKIFHLCALSNFRSCPGDTVLGLVDILEEADLVCLLESSSLTSLMRGMRPLSDYLSKAFQCHLGLHHMWSASGPVWDRRGGLCHAPLPKDFSRLLPVPPVHRLMGLFPAASAVIFSAHSGVSAPHFLVR